MVLIEELESCSTAGLSMRERLGISETACIAKDSGSDILCARWSARERSPQLYTRCQDPSPTPTPSPPRYFPGPAVGPYFSLTSESGHQDVVRWPNFDEVDDSSYFQQLGKQYRSTPPRFRSNLPEWPGFLGPQEPRLGTRQNPVVVDVDHDSQRYGRSITPEPRSRSSRDASPLSTGRIFDIHATTRTIWQRIAACARKPLFARDSKPGYIYVYTVPGNTDFVKIGFTTKRVRNRMQEWSRGCNRDPILLYPPKDIPEELIPHAQRVEALIHAELRPHRVAFFCESCRVEHNEWFRIPAEHAITVVRKWSDWMKATPYLPGVGMYAPFLSLRAVWRRKFADPEGYLKMASLTVI